MKIKTEFGVFDLSMVASIKKGSPPKNPHERWVPKPERADGKSYAYEIYVTLPSGEHSVIAAFRYEDPSIKYGLNIDRDHHEDRVRDMNQAFADRDAYYEELTSKLLC